MNAERLRAWNPTMRDYHADPSLSSGFLATARTEGLSRAHWELEQPWKPSTTAPLVRGSMIHATLSGDTTFRARTEGQAKAIESAQKWGHVPAGVDVDATMTAADVTACGKSIGSLLGISGTDTPAKRHIRKLYEWGGLAEVSHRWELADVPGCWCRIREDWIVLPENGKIAAVQIKTTARSLTDARKLYYGWRHSLALYREGLRDLIGSVGHLLVVASLQEPYPWGVYDLAKKSDDLDDAWLELLDGSRGIREIHAAHQAGKTYSNEEAGIFDAVI